MNSKTKALAVLMIGACIAGIILSRRPATPPVAPSTPPSNTPPPAAPVAVVETPPQEAIAPQALEPAPQPIARSHPKAQKSTQPQPQKPPKEPLYDPDARDALASVGLDPQAEQYWLDAIFDTNIPDKEREDLMEDLNEVGFADPDHPTADDLPLIVNRLQIIEQVAPQADPFMRIHLAEAYKDLANMYGRVTGQ